MNIDLLAGERQPGESSKAIQGCNDWLRLGPGRSLPALLESYINAPQNAATLSLDTLKHWSKRLDWMGRGRLYDAELERQKNTIRREEMESGLALDYKRVQELKNMALLLKSQLYHRDDSGKSTNLWLKDVKQIGSGDSARMVTIERFNAPLVSELRGVLDDLAKETGGRRQKVDNLNLDIDLSTLNDEQLTRLVNGENPLNVINSSTTAGES